MSATNVSQFAQPISQVCSTMTATPRIFYPRNSRLSRSTRYTNGSKIVLKVNQYVMVAFNGSTNNYPSSSTFRKRRRTWSFPVVVLQRTTKKLAQLLFCSLNLLFGDVLVAVVVSSLERTPLQPRPDCSPLGAGCCLIQIFIQVLDFFKWEFPTRTPHWFT